MKTATAILLSIALAGCATSFTGLCGMVPTGMTDSGIPVVKVH